MREPFAEILAEGGKSNSLGRSTEVIDAVLHDKCLLDELYKCLFHEDAWIRMRAADCLEKVCHTNPDWLLPYIDRFQTELASSAQPSIQWHLAQIYNHVTLTPLQRKHVVDWLTNILQSDQADWIVAANAMDTMAQFVRDGHAPKTKACSLFEVQTHHKSKAVVKRANKYLTEFS